MKRLDLNWGGYKDGTTFIVNPVLAQSTTADFVAQAEIAKLRTGVFVTRDADGFVIPVSEDSHKVRGQISFGFIDRLETREKANANMMNTGEGLSVARGRYGATVPASILSENCGEFKAGQTLYVDKTNGRAINRLSADGTTWSVEALEVGSIEMVDSDGNITIDIKL